ncbi:MAG: TVP38/TMEM64 family protein [Geitlerinemataceae cyanobacterium]
MSKRTLIALTFICVVATAIGMYFLADIDADRVEAWLESWGIWAPIAYIAAYTIGTLLLLPSTPLNLAGGALFGLWGGTLWSSIGAVIAALVSFGFARTVGRQWVASKLAGQWEAIDADIKSSGLFYLFAVRLLPILPYGLVNLAAGLTSVTWRDYTLATTFGTVLGLMPFIAIGSSGRDIMQGGSIWGLILALTGVAALIFGATWYRKRRSPPATPEESPPSQDT